MTEIHDEGLFLIDGGEVTHIHSSAGKKDLDALDEYLTEWELHEMVRLERETVELLIEGCSHLYPPAFPDSRAEKIRSAKDGVVDTYYD